MTANVAVKERNQRMQWWREARFGMFIHWGLYSQIARHEWVMGLERIPLSEYEHYADSWQPRTGAPREWARLARDAGMKYMVLTTKHLEGFCLWDTEQTDYNAVRRGPGRDLVREYVEACREFGLRVGFYYCLMDWHHADVPRCTRDDAARRRFVDFTHGCSCEFMPSPVAPGAVLSGYVTNWRLSQLMSKARGWTLAEVEAVGLDDALGWSEIVDNGAGMVEVHTRMGDTDGYVYLGNRLKVAKSGTWRLHFGHDGGAKVFMDRRPIISEPLSQNPADPWRHKADVELTQGTHEVAIALDLNKGRGWGIFFRWEQVSGIKDTAGRPIFPEIE